MQSKSINLISPLMRSFHSYGPTARSRIVHKGLPVRMNPYTFKNDWSDYNKDFDSNENGGNKTVTVGMTLQITPYPAIYKYDTG